MDGITSRRSKSAQTRLNLYLVATYKSFETERLILRPTNLEDGPFIRELINTPKWLRFVGDRNVHSDQEAVEYIKARMLPQLENLGYSNYTVIKKSDGAKIGCCGLYNREGLEGVDIGFALLPKYEKHGYAFEASKEMLRAAREEFGISHIKGITAKEHYASQSLLKKLGLSCTGTVILPDEDEELFLYEREL